MLLLALPAAFAGVVKMERITPPRPVLGPGASGAWPSISTDGRFVAFVSGGQIYVQERRTGATELVSVAADGGPANEFSQSPAISGNGRFIVFQSTASNLVAGDTNGRRDVFVAERE